MKRPRNDREVTTNSTIQNRSNKKQQLNSMSGQVKEEIVDQTHHQSSSSSSQVNHQVAIKKEEPSDDYDTKQKLIKCECKKEDCKSDLDLFKHEIKRECFKNEPDQDCGCNDCIQEKNYLHNQQDIHLQTIDDRSTDETQLEQNDDDLRCPTPDYLPSFFDSTDDDSDQNSEEDTSPTSPSPLSTNPTLNDQNIEDSNQNQEIPTSSPNHYVRRSNRTTAKPRSSYFSQYIESSDSEESDATKISNPEEEDDHDDDDDLFDSSRKQVSLYKNKRKAKSQTERNVSEERDSTEISNSEEEENDEDFVDDLSRKRVTISKNQRKRKTEQINTSSKKSKNQTESSGEETEVEGEEQEPNRQPNVKNLKRMITIVHLKCSVCAQKVKDEFELKLHQLTEHQICRFQCPVGDCSASFEYCEQVGEHKLTEHGDLSMWPCRECSYEANGYKRLLRHRWDTHQEGHFKCSQDGCQFESQTTRKSVLNHLQEHIPKFFCSYRNCNKSYKQKEPLDSHVLLVHMNKKPFACTQCSKSFTSQKHINRHVRNVHEAYKPYCCKWPNCTYTSGFSGNILTHIRVHHFSNSRKTKQNPKDLSNFVEKRFKQFRTETQNNREKGKDEVVVEEEPKDEEKGQVKYIILRLYCPVENCPKFAPNKIELNQHLLQCHQIDQHRCLLSDCTASFKYLKQLTAHRRNDHKNMDSYDCSKCNYTNRDYSKLISHNYIYHEIGHFSCTHDGCDFVSTTNRQKVDGHRYSHVEAKYKCSEEGCVYAAKDKRLLEIHLRRHREANEPKVVNRYDCSKCCRFFPRLSDIVRHEKSHLKDGYRCKWPGCDYFAGDTERIKVHLCADHMLKKPASNQWDKQVRRKYWKRVQFCHQTNEKVVVEEPKDVEVYYITLRLDCPVENCPEFAPNKIELNQHLLQCHQIDQHRCLQSNCTASFKSIKQLTAHRRNDHKNINFVCSKCDYSNRDYTKLKNHHYFYHEIGHFACPHDGCDFVSSTFRQKVDGHRYTHREYKCSEDGCSYTAKDKRFLAGHLRRHRESQEPKLVKRYDCSKCCRFFPRQTDIVRHEKSHLKNGYQCQWPGCDYFSGETKHIKFHLCEDHKFKKQASNQSDKEMWKFWKRVLV